MISAYTGTAVQAAEKPLLEAGVDLMARAAYGLANAVLWRLRTSGRVYGSSVALLIGPGNNGADALYAGELLSRRGVRTTAVLGSERVHGPAFAAFQAAGGTVVRLAERGVRDSASLVAQADLVVDGLLGTGARGGLRDAVADLVAALCEIGGLQVIACDLPSGVNADTGEVSGVVLSAIETVTFGGIKAGLLLPPGEGFAGDISYVDLDLSLPAAALERLDQDDLLRHWPRPGRSDHKYSRGVLGVVAGSTAYPGAAQLALHGALAAGTAMIRYLGPATLRAGGLPPEVVPGASTVAANRVQAWLVGPGVSDDAEQERRCLDAINSGLPVLADAGALPLLPERVGPQVVITPHAGELAALLSRRGHPTVRADVERSALEHARLAAQLTGATVLLKGATIVVVSPQGEVHSQSEGTPWLATAGSGDVLAGILGALLAAGVAPPLAAAMAASVHGRAGVLASGGGPMTASGIAEAVPQVLRELFEGID